MFYDDAGVSAEVAREVRRHQTLTNRDRLVQLAEASFGPRWQNATARALGINSRQVHRWVSGEHQPRDEVIRRMIEIALQRRATIDEAIRMAQEVAVVPRRRSGT